MSTPKQTAVDWLIEKIKELDRNGFNLQVSKLNELGMQAREMEREQIEQAQRPRWVRFSERKPPKADYYFVKGKGGYGAHLPYLDEIGEFEIYNLPVNKFEAEYLQWLEE